jgi:hypothetical protein
MQDKNQRVISLLELYARDPDKNQSVLEQANKYQMYVELAFSANETETYEQYIEWHRD